jgi:hypothetical protein
MRNERILTITLAITMIVAGCATSRVTYDKPGLGDPDRRRDEAECLRMAVGGEDPRFLLLPITVDRDAYERCMQRRGYTRRSIASSRS